MFIYILLVLIFLHIIVDNFSCNEPLPMLDGNNLLSHSEFPNHIFIAEEYLSENKAC